MTTTGTTTEPGTARLLRRACAAEWTRLCTVRATWGCLVAAAVTILGIGALIGIDAAATEGPWPSATNAGELAIVPGQLALLVLVVLAVSSEYATGAIGTTLQWTPRRGILLAARVLVCTAVAIVSGVVLALGADVLAWSIFPTLELTLSGLAESLAVVAGVLAAGALISLGVGFALRSTAGALAIVVLLMLVLPLFLPVFEIDWLVTLARHLPGGAALALLDGENLDASRTAALVSLVCWVVATLTAGALSLLRRDAT